MKKKNKSIDCELYKSIDELPIYNFDMIRKTNDFRYLYKTNDIEKIKKDESLEKQWEIIFNEYINEFGLSENYKIHLMFLQDAINHYNNAYNKGQTHEITFAKIAELKAEELMKQGENKTLGELSALIAKKMGFRINIKEISVREFYNYIKING
jgi:hypothetical protein